MAEDRYQAWTQVRAVLRVLFTVLGVLAALWLLYALAGVIALVVLAIFFAYVLSPAVRLVERIPPLDRIKRPRALAILVVYLGLFGSALLAVYALAPRLGAQLGELGARIPQYVEAVRGRAQAITGTYRAYQLPKAIEEAVESGAARAADVVGDGLRDAVATVFGWIQFLPWLVLIPILAFFFLKDAEAFRRFALRFLPEGRLRWRGRDFLDEVNRTLALYVRAQLFACLIVGAVSIIGFSILGVPYALLLGVLSGIFEFVPLVGPVLVALLAGFLAGTQSLSLMTVTLAFLVFLRMVEDYVVYPRLVASGMKLHPLAVILTLICGAHLAGVAGLFLAIPAAAVLMVAHRYLLLQLGQETLLGAFVHRPAEEEIYPLQTAPGPVRPFEAAGDLQDLTGISVAVVDNDEDARRALVDLLRESGAEVTSAASAIEALTLVEEHRPDVLLSDLMMPEQDGYDLIRAIRALPASRGGDLVAAALSGYGTKEDRSRALAAGFQEHLSKPVDPTELILTVRSLAGQSQAAHRAAEARH